MANSHKAEEEDVLTLAGVYAGGGGWTPFNLFNVRVLEEPPFKK